LENRVVGRGILDAPLRNVNIIESGASGMQTAQKQNAFAILHKTM